MIPFRDPNGLVKKKDQKSGTERKCSPGLVILVLFLFFLGYLVVFFPQTPQNTNKPQNTQTGYNSSLSNATGESLPQSFLKASDFILETLNSSVNPCDDFYEYVCGNYGQKNPIPEGKDIQGVFDQMIETVERQLLELLQSPEKSSSEAISKVKIVYNACVREHGYVNITHQATLEAIKRIGHWPILMGNKRSETDVQKMLERMKPEGVQLPWNIVEKWDEKNKSLSLAFNLNKLPDLSSYYSDTSKSKQQLTDRKKVVLRRIQQFAKETGYLENPNLDKDVDEMFNFESELQKIAKLGNGNVGGKGHSEPFDTFNERMRNEMGIDLKKIHLARIPEIAHGLYTSKTVIMVHGPMFAEQIARLIRNTEPRILINYLLYFMPLSFEIPNHKNTQGIGGKCKSVAMQMKKAVGALYARKYFDPESKSIAAEMAENLREAFLEMLDENEWMDEETKREAKKKAKEMIFHIAYNELAFDDEKLDKYYEEIDVSNYNDFYSMIRSLGAWSFKNYYEHLVFDRRRTDFDRVATFANAAHTPQLNSIAIPAAFLQFPTFLKDQPQSLNYGGIGSLIGHEITHGFDNQGKNYDELGFRRNWWGSQTDQKFKEKSNCMIDQYSAIEVPGTGLHINGKLTLPENIADNGGIRESFRAYRKYMKHHGKEPKLPGVDLTDEQLFFVGYANSFCTLIKKEKMKKMMRRDRHAPFKYRTNIVLQNMPEFSEAFKCPFGSPMNPEKKCRVW